jgi:hypothetical protein
MASPTIQFKRGLVQNLPGLRAGEPGFATDRSDFYVGFNSTTQGNKFFGSSRYWVREDGTNSLKLNLVDKTGENGIRLAAPNDHTGIVTYTLPSSATAGYYLTTNAEGTLSWASVTASATFENSTLTGVTTITDVLIQGGSINNTTVGLTTAAAGQFTTLGADSLNVTGIATVGSVSIGATQVVSSAFELQNILSLDATTIATIESAVANAPNTFTDLSITGISTFNGDVNLGDTSADIITVYGTATFNETITGTISTATRATQVDTTGTSTNADYYLTFVDTAEGQTGETLRVGSGVSFNPSTNKLSVVGDLEVGGIASVTQLSLSGTNLIDFASSGTGTPTYTTRSAGTKVVLYPSVGGSTVDYALGISAATLWNAVPENGSSFSFKWFGGETEVASLSGIGSLSVAGDIKVGGNDILASDGSTNITLTSNTLTAFAGDIRVGGNDIQASDGTTAITLSAVTGNVGVSSNLTVTGNLYVNGTTTQVNTTSLTVEDALVELGMVDGNAPGTDLNKDLGLLLNYFSGTAKKAAVYWDDSVSRIAIASDISEASSVLTANAYAALEVGSLHINNACTGGVQEVIGCIGSELNLQNIIVDGGTF